MTNTELGTMNSRDKTKMMRSGFTLIEVLLAIAIMGGALMAILEIQSRSFNQAARGNGIMQATFLAEEMMNKAKADYDAFSELPLPENASVKEFEESPGYTYKISKNTVSVPYGGQDFTVPGLYRITSEVYYPTISDAGQSSVLFECYFQVPDDWKDKLR